MEQDLRNAQSDEAVSASLQPKLRLVCVIPKKMEDVMLEAIDAFKAYFKCQPFFLVSENSNFNVYYRDYQYPANDEEMLAYAYSLGLEYANATDRHIKNLFHKQPQLSNHTPEYGC